MNITNVMSEQDSHSIPLEGWNKVAEALVVFDSGLLSSSRATQNNLTEAMDKMGAAMGLIMLASATEEVSSSNKFVTNLLSQAQTALQTQDTWHRSYDYDALGTSFFKSGVDIKVIDRKKQIFTLGINAAYVGDKPEKDLAKYLGVGRVLFCSTVRVQTDRLSEDRFSFDFEAIIRKLDNILGTRKLSGEKVVKAIMKTTQSCESESSFVLMDDDGLIVALAPGRVESRFKHELGKKTDTWKIEGPVLSGLLADSYEHKGQKDPPSFTVSIYRPNPTGYGNLPIWQPKEKDRVQALTDQIVGVFWAGVY